MGMGVVEVMLVALILLAYSALPIATLVLVFLIYRKVQRIEERLDRGQ